MQRREMLRVGAVAAAAAVTNPIDAVRRVGYQPIGYVNAWGPSSAFVDKVTVDGLEVPHCDEANDMEGWACGLSPRMFDEPMPTAVRYSEFSEVMPNADDEGGRIGTVLRVRYEGVVRISLKEPKPA